MIALAFLSRWWKPIAGALAVIAIILLYRAQMVRSYDLGKAACEQAHKEAAAKQQAKDQAAVNAADVASAKAQASIGTMERHYSEKVREIYRDRPARPCIDADGVRLVREADAAIAGRPAIILPDALREADAGR